MNSVRFLTILIIALAIIIVGFLVYTKCARSQINNTTLYMVIGVIVAAATGFIIYLMYKNEKPRTTQNITPISTSTENDSSFAKITDSIDTEHQEIMNALDSVYNLSKSHGDTERTLFTTGKTKLCSGHSDVTRMWTEHDQDHSSLLDKVIQLKKDFISHIENYDKPHFHWVTESQK